MKRKKNLNFFKLSPFDHKNFFLDISKTSNTIYNNFFKILMIFSFFFKKQFTFFSFFSINSTSFFFFLKKNYLINTQLFFNISKNLGIHSLELSLNKNNNLNFYFNFSNFYIFLKLIVLFNFFFYKLFFFSLKN
jgi:hypothetical protein